MEDQFNAITENGLITKDRLREALRLSECPAIDDLLHCRLMKSRRADDADTDTSWSISVSSLLAFVQGDGEAYKSCRLPCSGRGKLDRQQSPPAPPTTCTAPTLWPDQCDSESSEATTLSDCASSSTVSVAEVTNEVKRAPEDDQAEVRAPDILHRSVVAIAPRWNVHAVGVEAEDDQNSGRACGQSAEAIDTTGSQSSGGASNGTTATRDAQAKAGPSEQEERACNRTVDPRCTALVKHAGTVLGLRGKDAHRRPGPVLPVWRKRETIIQERIVQYTTLDEEGTIQELLETEKSQSEVLHMECKRTGEFAHRESTQYESGESFNGEVVVQETGAEHYVHLRSTDDEYEHLESNLPSRARSGNMAAESETGGCEPSEQAAAGACAESVREHPSRAFDDATEIAGASTSAEDAAQRRADASAPPSPPGNTGGARENTHHVFDTNDTNFSTPPASEYRGEPDPSPFSPSAYHYRSPSCSPRLSPRPARSPYRQEGIGGRESSGCGKHARSPEARRRKGETQARSDDDDTLSWGYGLGRNRGGASREEFEIEDGRRRAGTCASATTAQARTELSRPAHGRVDAAEGETSPQAYPDMSVAEDGCARPHGLIPVDECFGPGSFAARDWASQPWPHHEGGQWLHLGSGDHDSGGEVAVALEQVLEEEDEDCTAGSGVADTRPQLGQPWSSGDDANVADAVISDLLDVLRPDREQMTSAQRLLRSDLESDLLSGKG